MQNVDVGGDLDQGIYFKLPELASFDQDFMFMLVDKAEENDLTNRVNKAKDADCVQLYGTLYNGLRKRPAQVSPSRSASSWIQPRQSEKKISHNAWKSGS